MILDEENKNYLCFLDVLLFGNSASKVFDRDDVLLVMYFYLFLGLDANSKSIIEVESDGSKDVQFRTNQRPPFFKIFKQVCTVTSL